jgi:4-amino-4-deoxy-L-arabinose transferase-like glycosyltransferase
VAGVIARTDRRVVCAAPIIVFLVVLAVDVPMLASGVSIGDAAEAQTVPEILGIAHPTGFPAYTLAGWLLTHLLPFHTVAWRMNAFAALCTAASAAGVTAVAIALGSDAGLAAVAALTFAFGATVWSGALVANAQILAGPLAIAAMGGALTFARGGDRRAIVAAALACGLGIAAHPSAVWLVPAIVVAMLWQRKRLTPRTVATIVAGLAVPLALYAYLPIRSNIVVARGLDPTAAPPLSLRDGFDWNTNDPRTLDGFLEEVLGRREGAGGSFASAFDPTAIPAATRFWLGLALAQYAPVVLLLALAGAVALAVRDRRSFTVLLAGTSGGILFAYHYATDAHIDRYVFFSFAMTAIVATAAARVTTVRIGPIGLPLLIGIALAVSAGRAFAGNRTDVGEPWFANGEPIVAAVARDTPPGAIVVAQWNDAAALGYGAYVEHALGNRLIVSGWPTTYTERYASWTRARPVVLFVSRIGMMRGLPFAPNLRLHAVPSSLAGYAVVAVAANDREQHGSTRHRRAADRAHVPNGGSRAR